MFGKENGKDNGKHAAAGTEPGALSIIATGMQVRGDIEAAGIVKIDGRVTGDITSQRQVMIGRGATVAGNIVADEVVLAGTVTGNVVARSRLELQGSAVVHGDITTRSVVVLEGARINGAVKMEATAVTPNRVGAEIGQ